MKARTLTPFVAVLFAVLAAQPSIFAQSNSFILTLEQSTNGLGNWHAIQVTTNSIQATNAFYRVKIVRATPVPTPPPATNNMIIVQGGMLPETSQLAGTTVPTFLIGKYEVTWDEWQDVRAWAVSNGYDDLAGVGASDGVTGHPVHSVNWYHAAKWCNAKSEKEGLSPVYRSGGAVYKTGQGEVVPYRNENGYRLATEAEWEWAARGGIASKGFIYSGSDDINAVAWYNGNDVDEDDSSELVGTKLANELGIHDMSGNVWEWCQDSLLAGTSGMAVVRGGSWGADASLCAVRFRTAAAAESLYVFFGFRIARNAP